MARNRALADRLGSAVSTGLKKAQDTAQRAVGVMSDDEQTQYALQIASKNPEGFIAVVEELLKTDPQTGLAVLRALLRAVDPERAEEIIQALSEALEGGWNPVGPSVPPPGASPVPMPEEAQGGPGPLPILPSKRNPWAK